MWVPNLTIADLLTNRCVALLRMGTAHLRVCNYKLLSLFVNTSDGFYGEILLVSLIELVHSELWLFVKCGVFSLGSADFVYCCLLVRKVCTP